jgi:hypothetical protein
MRKKSYSNAAIALAACCTMVAMMGVSKAADKQLFTGTWHFNQEQSDDSQQKVHDAQDSSTRRSNSGGGGGGNYPGGGGYPGGGNPGGGYPGGGYPGGGMGGGIGRGGMGGPGGGGMGGPGGGGMGRRGGGQGSGVSSQTWDQLAADPKSLKIDQRDDQFVVIDDSEHSRTFYPDGKKHDDKDENGKKISTKSEWSGDTLTAETKLSRSGKLTETFRRSDDGKQMYVVTRFEDSSLAGPVSIRRVYDLSNATAH